MAWPKKGEDKKDTNVKFLEHVQNFGDSTTLHGLQYVTKVRVGPLRRFGWCLIILSALCWTSYSISTSFKRFLAYDSSTSMHIKFENKLVFPAVTFCNLNQWRSSAMDNLSLALLNQVYDPGQDRVKFDWEHYHNLYGMTENMTEFALRPESGSLSLEEMMLECTWNGVEKCGDKNFSRYLTDLGVCHTFNNPSYAEDALVVNKPGTDNGLTMMLNIGHYDYILGDSQGAGVKVYLHQQGERPLMMELGFAVAPGFETLVTIKSSKISTLPHPFESNCTEGGSLQYSDIYTVPLCLNECKVDYVTNICGCREYRFPSGAHERECPPFELFNCSIVQEHNYAKEDVPCNCPSPCFTHIYEGRLSTSYWPNRPLVKSLLKQYPEFKDKEDLRENLLRIKIFYEELSYTKINQIPSYDLASLGSEIGGTMGLFCGMSLITIVEFADFFWTLFFRKFCKK